MRQREGLRVELVLPLLASAVSSGLFHKIEEQNHRTRLKGVEKLCYNRPLNPYVCTTSIYIETITVSVACGATMNQNNSYAIISSYSTR